MRARGCSRPRDRCSPTSTPRAIPASAITAAANSSTSPKALAIERAKQPVRRRLRQRAAAFRQPGERGGVPGMLNPGDTIFGMSLDHGGHLTHGAKVNFSGKLFKAVQYGIKADTGDHRLRSGGEPGPGTSAENGGRRLFGLFAHHRLGAVSRHRRLGGRLPVRRHGACRGPGGCGCVSESRCRIADVVTTTTHKTLRGPRGGLILARPHADLHKKFNSMVFPGTQGGPADARDRRQGGGVSRSACSRSSRPTPLRW